MAGFPGAIGKLISATTLVDVSASAAPSLGDILTATSSTAATWQTPVAGNASGWISDANTWSYSSADSPTFVISINADMTAILGVGDRIKLTQTTAKYFIVTAVGSYSGGATLVTVYGGTDYTLANAAVTSPYYSHQKAPFGFPLDPTKWTVQYTNTGNNSQASPTNDTYYNLASVSITIPVGVWRTRYFVVAQSVRSAATDAGVFTALSTANNSASDSQLVAFAYVGGATGTMVAVASVNKEKVLNLASKTVYYLNTKTNDNCDSISNRNDISPLIMEAICAYL